MERRDRWNPNMYVDGRPQFLRLEGRNPKRAQFSDRILAELLVRHEGAIAMIGEIRDGPPINRVWVAEIGGSVKIHFALMDDGMEGSA